MFLVANTVATIDFAKQFKGGWVGIRYQIEPDEDYDYTPYPF
jgi:hypothetical protein